MLAPLFALSALGFSSPDSKVGPALKLRGGGVSTDALYKSTAYLNALVGLQGFLAPKSTIEMYGPTDLSEPETFQLRALSGVQVMAGVISARIKPPGKPLPQDPFMHRILQAVPTLSLIMRR